MEAELRPLRADAARNKARVLDAARTAFAELGLDVGVEEIARRAGVGKGTLYRRFPTKDALVRAIFEDLLDEIDELVAEAEAVERPVGRVRALRRRDRRAADLQPGLLRRRQPAARRGRALDPTSARARSPAPRACCSARRRRAWCAADLVPEDVQIMLRMVGAATRPAFDGTPMDEHWPRYLGAAARRAAAGGGAAAAGRVLEAHTRP